MELGHAVYFLGAISVVPRLPKLTIADFREKRVCIKLVKFATETNTIFEECDCFKCFKDDRTTFHDDPCSAQPSTDMNPENVRNAIPFKTSAILWSHQMGHAGGF